MLDPLLDVFRVRQYFNVAGRARELTADIVHDLGFLDLLRRAVVPLPVDRWPAAEGSVFGESATQPLERLAGTRVGLVATGGSGALASVVGVGRAFEEAGIRPAVISVCSGAALFGFPLAAGVPAEEVAEFTASLRPTDYIDVDWPELAGIPLRLGRGFAGAMRGDRVESTFRRLLGDLTLEQMPVPAYAPIWNIEHNTMQYLGPRTHSDLPVARAIRMAIALPLFIEPVVIDGDHWCDGGIVDIFPVRPLLDIEQPCDIVVAVNGFYPPEFDGEDATGWDHHRASILYAASQVRTSQQVQLARENLRRLRGSSTVLMINPVPYRKVRGLGFYRQFVDTSEWPAFMRAGREAARDSLGAEEVRLTSSAAAARST
jgi:NTE family protein